MSLKQALKAVTSALALIQADVREWAAKVAEDLGLGAFEVYEQHGNGMWKLQMLAVPKGSRKQGLGSQAMERLIDHADEQGKTIILSPALPDDKWGTTSRARLVQFYKGFGFVENKGRNKDFTISEGMYRLPKTKKVRDRVLRASTLAKKGHRFDTYFYGDDSGDWVASGAIFGFRKEWDWEMAPSLSSKNDWRNFSVEGATENNAGFRKALKAIVADYPEVADFWLSFDGPMKPVRDVLGLSDSDSWDDLVFLHGTSTTFLPTIEKEGLRPRGQTSVKPAYGHGSNAKPGNPDLLYFTTQETMAKFAARAAAAVHGGEPIILEVRNLDKAKAEPDEDSREKTAEASLARMGSIGYRGRVSASQIKARRSLSASALRGSARPVSAARPIKMDKKATTSARLVLASDTAAITKLAEQAKSYAEFLKKTDGKDVLYSGHPAGSALGNNVFMTDWLGHAEQYADDINDVDAVVVDWSHVMHFDNASFDKMREAYRSLSPAKLKSLYRGNTKVTITPKVLSAVQKALKGNTPYDALVGQAISKQNEGFLNDFFVPLMQSYAAKHGKNIISFVGTDYGDYGGQNEFVVSDVSKYKSLREIWEETSVKPTSARLVLASYVSAGEIFTDETGKFWGSQGAGGVFLAEDTGRILIQKRSPHVNEPNTYGTFGGKIDDGEDPKQAMEREIEEESSYHGPKKVKLVYTFQDGKFKFHNYLITVPHEFEPKHSWETSDHIWTTLDDLPSPLHFGFKSFLPHLKRALDDRPVKVAASVDKVQASGDKPLWHLTHDRRFKPSDLWRPPTRGGTDVATEPVLYATSDPNYWASGWASDRKWAAEIELLPSHPPIKKESLTFPQTVLDPTKVKVLRVIPVEEAIAETTGYHSGKKALVEKGYRFKGAAARDYSSKLAAKSFSDINIPRDFRLMFFLPNEKVPTLGTQLARRQLEGVTGITDSGQVLMLRMLGANRNAMLVMPGEQTAKLNKLSRIMYENPEYWMSKDMAALIRVYGGSTDREAAINRIFQAADKSGSKDFMRKVGSLDLYPSEFPTTPVNSVKDLARQWFTLAKPKVWAKMKDNSVEETDPNPAKWADSWFKDRYAELMTPKAYVKAITDGLKVIAKTFVWEGEWLLKDKTLRIPQGSRLFVTKPKGRSDQARFEAQQALIAEHGLDKVYKIAWVDGEKLQQIAMKYGMTAADKLVKQRLAASAVRAAAKSVLSARKDVEGVADATKFYSMLMKGLKYGSLPITEGEDEKGKPVAVLEMKNVGVGPRFKNLKIVVSEQGEFYYDPDAEMIHIGSHVRPFTTDANVITKLLTHNKKALIHEFGHHVDRHSPALKYDKASKSYAGPSDPVVYYNHPLEMNSYFRQGAAEVAEKFASAFADLDSDTGEGKPGSNEHQVAVWNLYDLGKMTFKQFELSWRAGVQFGTWSHHLTQQNKRRFLSRIYELYDRLVTKARQTFAQLKKRGDPVALMM